MKHTETELGDAQLDALMRELPWRAPDPERAKDVRLAVLDALASREAAGRERRSRGLPYLPQREPR